MSDIQARFAIKDAALDARLARIMGSLRTLKWTAATNLALTLAMLVLKCR